MSYRLKTKMVNQINQLTTPAERNARESKEADLLKSLKQKRIDFKNQVSRDYINFIFTIKLNLTTTY
jgi:hypothetical protein